MPFDLPAIVGLAAGVILALLALLHVYWAAGGRGGMVGVVPHDPERGTPLFSPGPIASLLVATLLTVAGALVLDSAGWNLLPLPPVLTRSLTCCVSLAFGLRAIGDFRWVGLFKKVRGTRFAELDSKLFVPLCLLLSVASAISASADVWRSCTFGAP